MAKSNLQIELEHLGELESYHWGDDGYDRGCIWDCDPDHESDPEPEFKGYHWSWDGDFDFADHDQPWADFQPIGWHWEWDASTSSYVKVYDIPF